MAEPIAIIDNHSRERLRRYFDPAPRWPFVAIGLGTLAGLSMWKFGFQPALAATWFMFTGVGILAIYHRRATVVSDREFDLIANADFERAATTALQRFQLEPADLRFAGHCKFRSTGTKRDIGKAFKGEKLGKDEKLRRTPHEFAIIYFGHEHLFVFKCVADLTSGSTLFEECRELSYRDVLSLDSQMQTDTIPLTNSSDHRKLIAFWDKRGVVPLNDALQLPGRHELRLRLTEGEVIELAVFREQTAGIPSGEGQKALAMAQQLRRLLRLCKQGVVGHATGSASGPGEAARR